jgi:UDP-glucuronate decarboxylase
VNIGNPAEFTMLELAQQVIALTQSKSKLVFMPLPQDDPKQRQPNIDLAKNQLAWQPKIALKDGLLNTIEYFQQVVHQTK